MRFETRSRKDGKLLFERLDSCMQTGVSNARNEALLCSIDPESIETTSSSSAERESDELWRYGVEWHVNSEDYADKARFIR